MTISPQTIEAIQRAGQALDEARTALADASQDQASRVAQALAANAFGVENDAQFEHWKAIARMTQSVQAMEEQLKTIFHAAGEIAFSTPALPSNRRQREPLQLGSRADVDMVPSDVSVKPVSAPKKRGRKPGKAKAVKLAKTGVKPVEAATPTSGVVALKGNAGRVFAFLQTQLNRRGFVRVTHAAIADGTPIPTGSVGAAIVALKGKGLLLEGERGSYRLA